MKTYINLVCLIFLLSAPAMPVQAKEQGEVLDRIVAVVNEDVITRLELQRQIDTVVRQLRMANQPAPPPSYLERQVLDKMIARKVQLQLAEKTGIRLDSGEINETLMKLAERNGMSLDAFIREVEKEGLDYEAFKQQLHDEMIIARLRDRDVNRHIQITDGEIERYMVSHAETLFAGYEYHLEHLLIKHADKAGEQEKDREQANRLRARLQKGESVSALLASLSSDRVTGGDLGWLTLDHMPRIYAEQVIGLQPGQVSPVLSSERGYHIVHLLEIRRGEQAASREKIRKQAREQLFITKAEESGQRWLKRLIDEAFVDIRL